MSSKDKICLAPPLQNPWYYFIYITGIFNINASMNNNFKKIDEIQKNIQNQYKDRFIEMINNKPLKYDKIEIINIYYLNNFVCCDYDVNGRIRKTERIFIKSE